MKADAADSTAATLELMVNAVDLDARVVDPRVVTVDLMADTVDLAAAMVDFAVAAVDLGAAAAKLDAAPPGLGLDSGSRLLRARCVIAVDTNILVYAHREESDWHARALSTVAELAESAREWAIPWPCLHEFLAIVTHPRIFGTPTPLEHAVGQVDAWLESPSLVVLSENDHYAEVFREIVLSSRVIGPRVHDARVAALCLSHDIREIWSADRDFSMFRQLTLRNPLVG